MLALRRGIGLLSQRIASQPWMHRVQSRLLSQSIQDDTTAACSAWAGATMVPSKARAELEATLNLTTPELLTFGLLPLATAQSICPVSNFQVGAVALCESGNVYLGANCEFEGTSPNTSVHAEQWAITSAVINQESRITHLAPSAVPCGHCRQFMSELNGAEDLQVICDHRQAPLPEWLPNRFSPADLSDADPLMLYRGPEPYSSPIDSADDTVTAALVEAATSAMNKGYSPNTASPAGLALLVGDKVASGFYIENAAYNPCMLPVQVALVDMRNQGLSWEDISRAVLVQSSEAPFRHDSMAAEVLEAVAPGVILETRTTSHVQP